MQSHYFLAMTKHESTRQRPKYAMFKNTLITVVSRENDDIRGGLGWEGGWANSSRLIMLASSFV